MANPITIRTNIINNLPNLPRGSEIVEFVTIPLGGFSYEYMIVTKTAIYYVDQSTTPMSLELAVEVQGIRPDPHI